MRLPNPKGVLFDFGDTLLKVINFDPKAGNKHLLGLAQNPNNVTIGELSEFLRELEIQVSTPREKSCIEFSCFSYQKILYNYFEITFSLSPLELEMELWDTAASFDLEEGILDVLDALQKKGIPVGIVSNSAFSEETLEAELKKHNLLDKFDFIMSSADYGFRKPHPVLFKVALAKLKLPADNVWFVGNSFEHDVKGAANCGLNAIWYNRDENFPSTNKIPFWEIKNYHQLLEKLID